MYIRKTTKSHKGKTYDNYLLVESVSTPKGPRQKIICSLGSLAPAPREHWLQLAHRVESSLRGQDSLQAMEPAVEAVVEKGQRGSQRRPGVTTTHGDALVVVDTERVSTENPREAGPLHVGHQVWRRLGLAEILRDVGLSERAVLLSEAMALNRLIFPLSEHAMPDWMRNTAMAEILGTDFSQLSDEALYRNLDRLHPQREAIERELAQREKTLFNLEDTVYLYDLTSTYFEGEMAGNPQAKRGYSRDKRPDCKQVVVGLVLDGEGFPKAHEVFEGNRQDRTTVKEMLESLEKRVGKKTNATVVIDRGMAYDENLKQIRDHGYHYLVACRQSERNAWYADLENDEGWEEVLRSPSPRNPGQKKSQVCIKRRQKGDELYILCRSEGRQEKDRAIRDRQQERWLKDLNALKARIENGHLKNTEKIHEALGRFKERYPRVARYYETNYDAAQKSLSWQEKTDKKTIAEKLDGSYLLKSDRQNWTDAEIWKTYILLTRAESAFRAMKSPLLERPIFHHLERRAQTHIFLCLLAYHLLVAIEKRFLDRDIHISWWTLRQQLRTHEVITVVLPTPDGRVLKIRKGSTPEKVHQQIYDVLNIPREIMKPVRTWHQAST